MIRISRMLAHAVGMSALLGFVACGDLTAPVVADTPKVDPPVATPAPPTSVVIDTAAARTAWAFVENNTTTATGLSNVIAPFQYVTAWDIGSQIAATYSAHALGIIADAAYDRRMRAILVTLARVPLFDGGGFNKTYDSHTGQMVDRNRQPSPVGYGWSATDMGRLLVWLRIVAVNEPQYAPLASALVDRIDMSRIIQNGMLQGLDLEPVYGFRRTYTETGLGYEQYAAAGYALWGHRAGTSLDASANARYETVFGVAISVDARGSSRITSEPYVMMGLETGFYSPVIRAQAIAVLAAQEARYTRTGIITMVSEDALPDPPYYFYYYSLFHNGRSFVVEGPDDGTYVDQPRWVSTKAAYGWEALFPTPYTRAALDLVRRAAIPGQGWGAGVYEGSGLPTGTPSLNTSALVLESLLYQSRGHPFLAQAIQ